MICCNCPKCEWTPPESTYVTGGETQLSWINIYPQWRPIKKIPPGKGNNHHDRTIYATFHCCPEHGEYNVK